MVTFPCLALLNMSSHFMHKGFASKLGSSWNPAHISSDSAAVQV